MVVAPVVILWTLSRRVRWEPRKVFEALGLVAGLAIVGLVVFGGILPVKNYPLEFLCVPLFVWAAFGFGQREAATAVLLQSGIAIWGTLAGFGPFVRGTPNEALLLLQAFMGVTAVVTLVLAAVVRERREGEERLRLLAVSDPLTGLANYRQLTHALEGEGRRSRRTHPPVPGGLLDLGGVEKGNHPERPLLGRPG